MVTGGGQGGRAAGRPGHGRDSSRQWPRIDRKRVLAVTLSLVTLLSVLVVPVAGAGSSDGGAVATVEDPSGAAQPVAENSQQNGNGQGNGNGQASGNGGGNGGSSGSSGGDGGDGGDDDSDDEEDDSDDGDGSSGNGGGQANGNGGGGDNGQAGGNGGGQANGNGGGGDNGQANGNGGDNGPSSPGSSGIDVGPRDVGSGGSPDASGPSNAGGNGPPDDAGPPASSNAGGSGEGGPPGQANAGAGGGPSVSVESGPGGAPGLERAQGASGGPAPSSVVSVSVENARAGDRVNLDVSTESAADDAVAFDGISVKVKRGGDFSMRVTNSRETLPGSPAFEPDQAADALGRVRLEHSITNEEVEEVSYTFRVSKAHLRSTDTDPEDVALFRHADGEWSELPTDVVGETRTHYLLSSDSPGMSEFAIGAKRPDFDTFWADVETGSVEAGETLTVRGRVTNDGGADGVYDARLLVDGEVVAERSITIAAGGTRQINFQTTLDRTGSRQVSINEVSAGEVDVAERASTSDEERTSEATLSVVIDRLLDVGKAIGIASS